MGKQQLKERYIQARDGSVRRVMVAIAGDYGFIQPATGKGARWERRRVLDLFMTEKEVFHAMKKKRCYVVNWAGAITPAFRSLKDGSAVVFGEDGAALRHHRHAFDSRKEALEHLLGRATDMARYNKKRLEESQKEVARLTRQLAKLK